MSTVDVWQEVPRLRCQFADRIESLDETAWNTASWCEGWRVRDVLAHLVLVAEATQLSMARNVLRGGLRPNRTVSRAAQTLGDTSVPELAGRLRKAAERRFHVLGSPSEVALGEVLVHPADALRPVGLDGDAPPADAAPVLDVYCRMGRFIFGAASPRRVRLTATDLDWSRGSGPEVRGRAIDLLLLVANRRQVLPCLEGPGLAEL
jgi:uncharacterized protein (TIGR03083 family)